MDPYYEQRLRDEVIYLHSLWHQGPPRPAAAAYRPHLQPVKATQFKKKKKRRAKIGQKSTNTAPETNSSAGAEWPCPPSPPPSPPTGWPNWEQKPKSQPNLLSIDEQSKLDSKNAHQNALRVVREFLVNNNADDSDAVDSSSDEGDELMKEDCEYKFFFKVFKDDTELREYYEKNFARGEFNCLVCGAIGGKGMGKKFKGCLPVVQHSIAIAKTKRRRAHRAFGQAICKVLGWDIDNLPALASMLSGQTCDSSGAGSGDDKERSMILVNNVVSVNNDDLEGKNEEAVPESVDIRCGILRNGDEGDVLSAARDGDGSSDNKESSMILVNNVVTVNNDDLEDKNEEAAPESVSIRCGISLNGDEGDVNSITCPDADINLEADSMVRTDNVEQPAPDGLTSNSLASTDADKNSENLGVVRLHNLEDIAPEWLRNMCPNVGLFYPCPRILNLKS